MPLRDRVRVRVGCGLEEEVDVVEENGVNDKRAEEAPLVLREPQDEREETPQGRRKEGDWRPEDGGGEGEGAAEPD